MQQKLQDRTDTTTIVLEANPRYASHSSHHGLPDMCCTGKQRHEQ
jgi:hypothetical protein